MKRVIYGLCIGILSIPIFALNFGNMAFSADAQEINIEPSVRLRVWPAKLRTAEDIQQAEAALAAAPIEEVNLPFLSDMAPEEYKSAKEEASSEGESNRQSYGPVESLVETLAPPAAVSVNYAGLSQSGAFPPDTHGAVGPNNFVEAVNTRIGVFNKANPGVLLTQFTLQALFGVTEFLFDPRVVYDQTWNRWVIVATRRSASTTDTVRRFFLAVSQTSNPAGPYFTYTFNFGGGPFNNGDWWDFPQLGMDQDALIITGNVFDVPAGGFKFAAMTSVAKARVYNGLGFSVPVFTGLVATLAPPIVLDQNKDAYLVAANNFTHLHLYRGENLSNASEATLVLQALVPVPVYAVPPTATQLGTAQRLDTSDRRFVNASTQIGDSLWNVHTINFGGFARPKYYQIDTEGAGINTIKQQAFFAESGTSHNFNASIAVNTANEAFVTWSTTDTTNPIVALRHNARVRASGRQPADPVGIPAGTAIFTSAVALTGNPSSVPGVQRWGDYSAVSLDPTNSGCGANRRAWIVNETIPVAATWGSRIARIGFCP